MRRRTLAAADNAFGYRPALDGARTIAVYLVVAFHAGLGAAENGFVGVDLFFVLSGFLVTNVLLSDVADGGGVRLRRFYARRVRRLLPAAAVVIVSVAFLYVGLFPITERLDLVGDARAAALYVANWHFIGETNDYFAAEGAASPYLHFWSLAIEEQFYLVYPIVLIGLIRLQRRMRHAVLAGIAALVVLGVAVQLAWSAADDIRAYYGTDARVYQMLAGAAFAVTLRARMIRLPRGVTELGVLGLVFFATPVIGLSPSLRGITVTVLSVLVIFGLEAHRRGPAHVVLSTPTMVRLGRVSYGTYLWHWPVILCMAQLVDLGGLAMTVVAGLVSTAMAALSALLLEDPIRRSRRLDVRPRVAVAGGLALSVLVAIGASAVLRRDVIPLRVAGAAEVSAADIARYGEVPDDVDWYEVRSGGLTPTLGCSVETPERCLVVDGGPGSERVLLVGDSHGMMIEAALAELARTSGDTFMAMLQSACTWVDGLRRLNAEGDDECQDARGGWSTEVVDSLAPTHVVLVQRDPASLFGRYEFDEGVNGRDEIERLMRATFENLAEAGVDVTVLDPTPEWDDDPIDCMASSRYVGSCLTTVAGGRGWAERALRRAAEGLPGVRVVDIDAIPCPSLPTCAPYLDGAWVMRDRHHVQPTWWLEHRGELARVVDPLFRVVG